MMKIKVYDKIKIKSFKKIKLLKNNLKKKKQKIVLNNNK